MPQFFTEYLSEVVRLTSRPRIARHGWRYDGMAKRAFDLTLALILLVPVGAAVLGISVWLRAAQGAPVFFLSERMGRGGRPFHLLKFRTMRIAPDAGIATGGDKATRITRPGGWLRERRLDELPQLWNILRGDMSFVGPRPPLRRYVARHRQLYGAVLRSQPGVTGLATLVYHRAEARLLGNACDAAETDELYSRVCVPRKARLDLIYQRNTRLCLDIFILWRTLLRR